MTVSIPLQVPDTPTYRLVEEKLGRSPLAFINERRKQGLSWARIAHELRELTGEYMTHELPRRWYFYSIGTPVKRAATSQRSAA